jgi:hypothetical protein
MSENGIMNVWINPLQFKELDEPWASMEKRDVTPESLLDFLCTPGIGSDIESLVSRYRQISVEKARLFAAPNEQRILDKLVWPLRHAKAGFMCGNYLGTIALCGMVGEMVALLIFQCSDLRINEIPISEEDQQVVFGRKFEKLGQERRVEILSGFGFIDDTVKNSFDTIRKTRNLYLHLWSQDHEQLPRDAVKCFEAATVLVVSTIGQKIAEDGRLILKPEILNYLNRYGIYSVQEEE